MLALVDLFLFCFSVVHNFATVDKMLVLSGKMLSFGVVCHVVWDGDIDVFLDVVYEGDGFTEVYRHRKA